MAEIEALLDNRLRSLSRQVLRGGGSVKTTQASAHALGQYRSFNESRKAIRPAEADANLAALKAQEKLLPKQSRQRRKPHKETAPAGGHTLRPSGEYVVPDTQSTMDQHNGEILARSLSTPGAVFRINPFGLDDPGGFFVGGLF